MVEDAWERDLPLLILFAGIFIQPYCLPVGHSPYRRPHLNSWGPLLEQIGVTISRRLGVEACAEPIARRLGTRLGSRSRFDPRFLYAPTPGVGFLYGLDPPGACRSRRRVGRTSCSESRRAPLEECDDSIATSSRGAAQLLPSHLSRRYYLSRGCHAALPRGGSMHSTDPNCSP